MRTWTTRFMCVALMLGMPPVCADEAPALSPWQRSYLLAEQRYAKGDYHAAARAADDAVALAGSLEGEESGAVRTAASLQGAVRLARADLQGAEDAFMRALRIVESEPASDPLDAANLYNNLAEVARERGRHGESIDWQRKRLALVDVSPGIQVAEKASALQGLALALHDAGNLDEAGPLYVRALALMAATADVPEARTMALLANQADLLGRSGQPAQAMANLRRVLAWERSALGDAHPAVASTLNTLATLEGDANEAMVLYTEALQIRRAALGPRHPGVATILVNLAMTSRDLGHTQEARRQVEEAIDIMQASMSDDDERLASAKRLLAKLGGE